MNTAPNSSAPPARVPGRTLAGVLLLMFLVSIDATIVGPALPAMGASLGDFAQLPWVITGYLLAATVIPERPKPQLQVLKTPEQQAESKRLGEEARAALRALIGKVRL